jgi:hypothetical protein
MEIVEERIAKIDELIDDAVPGSEEHERLVNSQAALIKANAEDKKVDNEVELKKNDSKKAVIAASITAGGLLLGSIIRDVLKYITNKHALKTEEYDVINSKTYDNR